MELSTITEERDVARDLFQQYRAEVRKPLRAKATEAQRELRRIDTELARAYKQLSDGVTLLRLGETLNTGGFTLRQHRRWGEDKVALPNLAIAKATARNVWCDGIRKTTGTVRYSWELTWQNSEMSVARDKSLLVEDAFAVEALQEHSVYADRHRAIVPTVPPQFRPESGLSGYHILFEAEWEHAPVPADPALLRHVGGDLWAVLATWDLSPLEAAVLGHRN